MIVTPSYWYFKESETLSPGLYICDTADLNEDNCRIFIYCESIQQLVIYHSYNKEASLEKRKKQQQNGKTITRHNALTVLSQWLHAATTVVEN